MSVQHSKAAVPEAAWIKSSYSTGNGGECVEAAPTSGAILVRDSKRPAVARLAFGAEAWAGFVRMAARR
ncbi:DUF397 domain-containing protein [Streptomyces nodosus]|uniref:DUF397 domain-containing protein n=1 Tax=Streptomyces nodosus TaxID=40318 RepID=A0A0B5DIA9_9ACTN|nr:DUF397 domain-containing protein [Streptomyces nodosus]AJE43458.1 hypothetical protein SNOD_28110 [Streptomyces nodosus]MBB4794914.1 hypothetical protein [Streptomyces nodosus]QEV41960.1 DUF397 domain-containing protein [Streptomyces nodosus]